MHVFDEIAADKSGPVEYELREEGKRIGRRGYKSCLSISRKEFDHIRNYVKENDIWCGLEIGTALGISALAFSLGLKDGGRKPAMFCTMDAYCEEKIDDGYGYLDQSHKFTDLNFNAQGFASVYHLKKKYGLEGILFPTTGWSPEDVPKAVNDGLMGAPLEVVFIDAGHNTENAIRDTKAILPFLNKKRYTIFYHDTHMLGGEVWDFVKKNLGEDMVQIPELTFPNGGYYMGIVSNL
jgi:hypothetical protein